MEILLPSLSSFKHPKQQRFFPTLRRPSHHMRHIQLYCHSQSSLVIAVSLSLYVSALVMFGYSNVLELSEKKNAYDAVSQTHSGLLHFYLLIMHSN